MEPMVGSVGVWGPGGSCVSGHGVGCLGWEVGSVLWEWHRGGQGCVCRGGVGVRGGGGGAYLCRTRHPGVLRSCLPRPGSAEGHGGLGCAVEACDLCVGPGTVGAVLVVIAR